MKSSLYIPVAFFLSLLFITSCNINCVDPAGPIITDKRDVDEFSSIIIDIPANVKVIIGKERGITIKSYESYIKAISTVITRNKLEIVGDVCNADNSDIEIVIHANSLDKIKVAGSADVYSDTPLNTNDIELEVNGSGSLRLNVFAKYIDSSINGSGNISLAGTCQKTYLKINGSGEFKGLGLNTYSSKIKINGSGNAFLTVHDKLSATVNGSGVISYSGNPEISMSITGSGHVNKIN